MNAKHSIKLGIIVIIQENIDVMHITYIIQNMVYVKKLP